MSKYVKFLKEYLKESKWYAIKGFVDLLQVYFNFTKGKGNAKEEKLKTRRDGGKGRKEGGGENIFSSSFLSSLPPVSPRFQFFLLRISFSFGKIKIDLEQV